MIHVEFTNNIQRCLFAFSGRLKLYIQIELQEYEIRFLNNNQSNYNAKK